MFTNPLTKLTERSQKRAYVTHRIRQTLRANDLTQADVQDILETLLDEFGIGYTIL